eukprot:m.70696 g.70696  ORF g.70696 m.70696 type:complete len:505 (-) comp14317_c1_seq1:1876-3390(-)
MSLADMASNQPEELRRKLALLEGDRKAYFESSQAAIQQNRETVEQLRRENKSLTARIKSLNAPSSGPTGPKAVEQLDNRIAEQIKRHNGLRYQVRAKQEQLLALEKQLHELTTEESFLQRTKEGESEEGQRLRELENRLEKATIKAQEAQHIGRTYQQIITKLQQDRLTFDGKITSLEKTIGARRQDLEDLEAMCNDALIARDTARRELAQVDQEFQAARSEREKEKKRLDSLAEERRRQYEAMEKRLRLASSGKTSEENEVVVPTEETRQRILTYEDAMEQIKNATGVSNVQEVVERFLSQGSTKEHLEQLKIENTTSLAALKEEYQKAVKSFETIQYSGETRNSSNQRMLKEFEAHLQQAEAESQEVCEQEERDTQRLVKVKAGVDHLHDKLQGLSVVQIAQPANTIEKLTEAELKLEKLLAELEAHKEDLPAEVAAEIPATILPEFNTRIQLDSANVVDDSDSEEDEVVSRDLMKRHAQNVVDARTAKPKKTKSRRKKNSP